MRGLNLLPSTLQPASSFPVELDTALSGCARYKFAAFCYEDLILIQPYNWMYHVKYAEVRGSLVCCTAE